MRSLITCDGAAWQPVLRNSVEGVNSSNSSFTRSCSDCGDDDDDEDGEDDDDDYDYLLLLICASLKLTVPLSC